MYDIIGDVHGHERALRRLLAQLGYKEQRGCFSHPTRKAIFVGDIIDRGPQIRETLTLIRRMVEAHAALCVMGNHELNALGFHTPSTRRPSSPMRPRTPDNTMMHSETIRQFPEHERLNHLAWFRSLTCGTHQQRLPLAALPRGSLAGCF